MAPKKRNKRKQRHGTDSTSASSVSDTSLVPEAAENQGLRVKKQKTTSNLDLSNSPKDTRFQCEETKKKNMEVELEAKKNKDHNISDSEPEDYSEASGVFTSVRSGKVSNEDIMEKLCSNGHEISKLTRIVEELQSALMGVQIENDKLKQEVEDAKRREDQMKDQLAEARHLAELADQRSEELSCYIRRNNMRIYGIKEPDDGPPETQQQCEEKVLSLINKKLKLNVRSEDIEAVHRLGQRRSSNPSSSTSKKRGIIVRFISRRVRDAVLYARRDLKGTNIVFVEDLTPRAYSLLTSVKSDTAVCQQAWSKNGNILMKTVSGKIVTVRSKADLQQTDQRRAWSKKE